MSATTVAPAGGGTGTGGARRGRRRTAAAVTVGFVLAVLVVLAVGVDAPTTGDLDPGNPEPGGARAVAQVLGDRGVDVTVVRSADDLDDTPVDAATTVLVTSTDALGTSTARRLLEHRGKARVVLAGVAPGAAGVLDVPVAPSAVRPDAAVPAACDDPTYDGLALEVDDALAFPLPGGCFRTGGGVLLTDPVDGVTVLGAADALANDQVLRADNAAVVLRLLGADERLVWYVPTIDDLSARDGVSLRSLLPAWVLPALLLLAVAVVAVMLWRGRRLGPLATEPLPVVVRAIETTRSRGRLYRRSADRGHAAGALRSAARSRAAERLGLPTSAGADAVVRGVARHTGRPAEQVATLLSPDAPAPRTDRDLITLAADLAGLDREVRRT